MTRLAIIAFLAVLAAAPAAHADSTRNKILRECQNGRLTGDYTAKQIRDARNNIPDDLDQYSDCRDVLTSALLNRAGGSGNGGSGGSSGGTGAASGGSGGGGDDGPVLTPSTDADRKALEGATAAGGEPLQIAGGSVTPGTAARNDLPSTLLVVLILLAAAAAAATAPFVRRRFVAFGPALRRVLPGRTS